MTFSAYMVHGALFAWAQVTFLLLIKNRLRSCRRASELSSLGLIFDFISHNVESGINAMQGLLLALVL